MSHAEPIHVEFVEVQGVGHVHVYLGEKEKLPQRPSRYILFFRSPNESIVRSKLTVNKL